MGYEEGKIHFAEDRCFFYQDQVYDERSGSVVNFSLAFQRELTNHIIRKVNPDVVHCNDWTTGLITGFTRRLGIPSLFTVHNIYTEKATLSHIEDRGIDAPTFWQNLFFLRPPQNYEESRDSNFVDLLCSGIHSATMINTVSAGFLHEVIDGWHEMPEHICNEIRSKYYNGYAHSILNAPDKSYNPAIDSALYPFNYSSESDFIDKKKELKLAVQRQLGLAENPNAPMLFWPSRLDPTQKGCELLGQLFYHAIASHAHLGMQIVIVADGPYFGVFEGIIRQHQIHHSAVIHPFNSQLSRKLYGASDFIIMPSKYEPCGLAQMISQFYGSLPIVMNTGGLSDTVNNLDWHSNTGSGFRFDNYDSGGLWWGISRAMEFYQQEEGLRYAVIQRIMRDAANNFNIGVVADSYSQIYEKLAKVHI